MPKSLTDAFAQATGENKFELANPTEKFQETDVIVIHGLPLRRLVFAGSCEKIWFVYYEHGGFAHSYKVLIFRADPKDVLEPIWGGSGFVQAKSIDQLRTAIRSGKFPDEAEHYW